MTRTARGRRTSPGEGSPSPALAPVNAGLAAFSVPRYVEDTVHRVTVPASYYEKLTGRRVAVEELVRLSFEFLLEREPKESILRTFELPVIGRYFPEFEREITRRLGARAG